MADQIRISPDTGLPFEEIAFHLAVSDQVKESLDREEIVRTFGRYLLGIYDDLEFMLTGEPPIVAVRIEARDDGGYTMTLAEDDEEEAAS